MMQYIYDVFISYRRKGGSEKAQLVKSELKQRGIDEERIFLDTHNLHDGDFEQKIKVAIEQSKCVVVVISDGCFDEIKETDYWYMEINEAIVEGKQIVPIFFDGIMSFASLNVPEELAELTKMNAVTYHNEYANAAFDKVLTFVGYENRNASQQPNKKGCLFSFKYKGCLLSVTLIALLVFVIVPITMLQFDVNSPSPSNYPNNDVIIDKRRAEEKLAYSDMRSSAPMQAPSSASPNKSTPEMNLWGEWHGTINRTFFQFNSNHVIVEEGNDSNIINRYHGSYRVNGDTLFFVWSKSECQTARYKLKGGKLILSFDDGKTVVLTK